MYKDLCNCMRETVYGSNRKYESISVTYKQDNG